MYLLPIDYSSTHGEYSIGLNIFKLFIEKNCITQMNNILNIVNIRIIIDIDILLFNRDNKLKKKII